MYLFDNPGLFVMCSLAAREKAVVPPHGLTYPLEMPLFLTFLLQLNPQICY